MTSYRLIPLDDAIVFPGMQVTLSIDPGADSRVLLVPRRGDEFAKVGVVAEVTERVKRRGRGYAVSVMGLHKFLPQTKRRAVSATRGAKESPCCAISRSGALATTLMLPPEVRA